MHLDLHLSKCVFFLLLLGFLLRLIFLFQFILDPSLGLCLDSDLIKLKLSLSFLLFRFLLSLCLLLKLHLDLVGGLYQRLVFGFLLQLAFEFLVLVLNVLILFLKFFQHF